MARFQQSDILHTAEADPLESLEHDPSDPNPCPPLSAHEYEALKRSIAEDGFIPAFPVLISAGPACEGQIIDGFHRTKVCEELEVEPVRLFHPCETELDFRILQIKANLERRQLTTQQRALLAVRLLPLYEERAAERQIGALAQNAPLASRDANGETGKSAGLVAEAAGVSQSTVERAKAVVESGDAELIGKVQSGEVSIKRAYEQIRKSPEDQERERLWAEQMQQEKLEREIDKAYVTGLTSSSVTTRERDMGELARAVIELDRLIQRTGLYYDDLASYGSLPHTFPSTVKRLYGWTSAVLAEDDRA